MFARLYKAASFSEFPEICEICEIRVTILSLPLSPQRGFPPLGGVGGGPQGGTHITLFLTDHAAIAGNVQSNSFGANGKNLSVWCTTSDAVFSVCITLT